MKSILFCMCTLFLTACSDLSVVRDTSARLTKANNTWSAVGAELPSSCQREARLNVNVLNCDDATSTAEGIDAANKILGEYFRALMDVATESNFTIQPGLDKATKSVSQIPGIKKERVIAVSGLVGLITQLTLNGVREHTLYQLIHDGAPYAKSVISGLSEVLVTRLTNRLDNEKIQVIGFYSGKLAYQRDEIILNSFETCNGAKPANLSATGFLLVQDYCTRIEVIEARKKAILTYQASLQDASEALTELQSAGTKLDTRELAKKLYKIGVDLDTKIDTLNKAFN
ncbi:hypothetical protein [Serratia plymuthica]|uniref:hypothetical protein n=1 Tax=Serratia TaxID=613 RepID=UPI0002A27F68|nr:hypothetical protein [Serratia plymuthica]EKF63627.1 putative lipoprotein [Serratia plymuthica A30]MBI6138809.1 hypothetical protein [Serratia plymuthica]UJE00100.1 hypothetical protein FS592_16575 [Serratia plymuthica]